MLKVAQGTDEFSCDSDHHAIHHKPCSRLSIFRTWELNLIHLNDLKDIVQRSCTENTEHPDRFMCTALGNPLGAVVEKYKLFENVTNLSRFLSDL